MTHTPQVSCWSLRTNEMNGGGREGNVRTKRVILSEHDEHRPIHDRVVQTFVYIPVWLDSRCNIKTSTRPRIYTEKKPIVFALKGLTSRPIPHILQLCIRYIQLRYPCCEPRCTRRVRHRLKSAVRPDCLARCFPRKADYLAWGRKACRDVRGNGR